MKKKVVLILAIVCLIAIVMLPAFSSCSKRENVLKVLSWDEYLDEETLIPAFEAYYKEVTGQKIKVNYQSVETNEIMYTKIATSHSDFDVLCPSDYMVEKMHKEGLLLKQAADLGEGVTDYRKDISPFFTDPNGKFNSVNPEYVTAYMWGTLGIVYNRSKIPTEEIKSQGWNALFNKKYSGKIQMKNSVRDSYVAAAMVAYKEEIANGTLTVAEVINKTDDEAFSKVKSILLEQKALVVGYETDNGKTDIIEGTSDILLQWSGDAVYTLSEELQMETVGKTVDLAYYAPEEGGNLWCDYWVIPKYAGNQTAANLWINFMCKESSAIANMDYIGYTTAVATEGVFDYALCDEENDVDPDRYAYADLSYFFTNIEDAKNIYTDIVQFPSAKIVSNAEVMLDFGARTQAISNMWTDVSVS